MLIRKMLVTTLVSSTASFVNGDIFEWRDYDQDGNENSWLSDSVIMDGADLSGQWLLGAEMRGHGTLEGLDLSHAVVSGSRWGTHIQGGYTHFHDSDASWATLVNANMYRGSFNNNNFSNANFYSAKIYRSWIKNSNFHKANFIGVEGYLSRYDNGIFTYTNFMEANLANSFFEGAIFDHANFTGANFTKSTFLGADFTGSLNWSYANWTGAMYNDDTIFADGMNPNALGMVNVPAPGVLAILGLAGVTIRRRRN